MNCDFKSDGFHDGKDVRHVQLKLPRSGSATQGNRYGGPIYKMCKGCRGLHHGQYRYFEQLKP